MAARDKQRHVCQFCAYWCPVESEGGMPAAKAECRRFPPVPALLDDSIEGVFPPTVADTWCGEFKQQSLTEKKRRESGRVMVYPPGKRKSPK